MGDLLKAIILGIVQGLTEFLPVSSSGHLEIGKALLGTRLDAEMSLLMTVVLHAATALSTIVVFRREILDILRGLCHFRWNEQTQYAVKIVLSMLPAVFVGLVFEKEIESWFSGNLLLVGSMLLATGLLLILASRNRETTRPVGYLDSLLVGLAQAVAILPGISRSGATISTCMLLGIDRVQAARFSFLMVVPLIMGKMAKDVLDNSFSAADTPGWALLAGFVAAFLTGLLACRWMVVLVRNSRLTWFAIYCFAVGALAIVASQVA